MIVCDKKQIGLLPLVYFPPGVWLSYLLETFKGFGNCECRIHQPAAPTTNAVPILCTGISADVNHYPRSLYSPRNALNSLVKGFAEIDDNCFAIAEWIPSDSINFTSPDISGCPAVPSSR